MCKGVYLLHFDEPLDPSTPNRARHYIGYADNINHRVSQHRKGRGSKFCAVAKERGIAFHLARTWPGEGRDFERQLKGRKNAPRDCPFCQLDKQPF